DLVGGGLADLHHGLGDGLGQLALLLVGAAGVPLNGDVRHGLLPRDVGAANYPMRAPGGQRRLTVPGPSATIMDTVAHPRAPYPQGGSHADPRDDPGGAPRGPGPPGRAPGGSR